MITDYIIRCRHRGQQSRGLRGYLYHKYKCYACRGKIAQFIFHSHKKHAPIVDAYMYTYIMPHVIPVSRKKI